MGLAALWAPVGGWDPLKSLVTSPSCFFQLHRIFNSTKINHGQPYPTFSLFRGGGGVQPKFLGKLGLELGVFQKAPPIGRSFGKVL